MLKSNHFLLLGGFTNSTAQTSSSNSNTCITPEIYSQHMTLLKNSQASDPSPSAANFADHINFSIACFSDSNNITWILDRGVSDHMCFHRDLFFTFDLLATAIIVSLPTGHLLDSTHTGTILISSDITLHNVLYISHFELNFLSINKLTHQMNFVIIFILDSYFLHGSSLRKPLDFGKTQRGLYLLNHPSSDFAMLLAISSSNDSDSSSTNYIYAIYNVTAGIID